MKDKIIEILKDYTGCTDTNGQTTLDEIILGDDIEEIATRIDSLYSGVIEYGKADPDKWAEHKNGTANPYTSLNSKITIDKSQAWEEGARWALGAKPKLTECYNCKEMVEMISTGEMCPNCTC